MKDMRSHDFGLGQRAWGRRGRVEIDGVDDVCGVIDGVLFDGVDVVEVEGGGLETGADWVDALVEGGSMLAVDVGLLPA